jgi:hypothetical protein
VPPPGGKGTRILIGLSGNFWAEATKGIADKDIAITRADLINRFITFIVFSECFINSLFKASG